MKIWPHFRVRMTELLNYDPETGIFTWKAAPKGHPEVEGKQAGYMRAGYLVISIDGKQYPAHRLAWLWIHGIMPSVIDHVNRVKTDNRSVNLRECSRLGNARNHSRSTNGSGLPVGVRKSRQGRFVSRLRDNGKLITLGTFDTPEQAHSAYLQARKEAFAEFCPL